MNGVRLTGWLLPLLASLVLMGCATSAPSRHFTLEAVGGPAAVSTSASSTSALFTGKPVISQEPGPRIIVGPIDLPTYLDRPQMVIRTGDGELQLREFARWAEPLSDALRRVLVENLDAALATARVLEFPAPGRWAADLRLTGRVTRFDSDRQGRVLLQIQWSVTDGQGKILVPVRRSRYVHDAGSADSGAIVRAMSAAVADLAAEMTATLNGALAESSG